LIALEKIKLFSAEIIIRAINGYQLPAVCIDYVPLHCIINLLVALHCIALALEAFVVNFLNVPVLSPIS